MTSHPAPTTKVSLTELADRKSREKLVMLTAYDHPGARLADASASTSFSLATPPRTTSSATTRRCRSRSTS